MMRQSSISSNDGLESQTDREQRLRSAKKKLKSYRAKQAQMEQAKRQSLLANNSSVGMNSESFSSSSQVSHSSFSIPASQSSSDRLSVQSDRLMGSLINEAAKESNQSIDTKRHSRTFSRNGVSGHGRGHSRTGSISLAASGFVVSAPQLYSAGSSNTSTIATSNRLSTSVSASAFIASTPHSHTRGHSRSHSRNGSRSLASGRSRPTSLIIVAKKANDIPSSGDLWRDVEERNENSSNQTDENDIDMLKTPTLASTSRLANDSTPMADSSNLQRPRIFSTPATPVYSGFTESNDDTPIAHVVCTSATHSRRPSRHSRKDSVSTRKESMEIMGGLGSLGISPANISAAFDLPASNSTNSLTSSYSQRQSRRISSQRWSGLQSASVLFGGPADGSGAASKRSSFDWRSAIASAEMSEQANGGDDRLTALEKLEGRSKRHSHQSSVQLPSFDEVHGEQGMDKRASQDLIELNLKTTNSTGSLLASVPFAAPPASPSASANATLTTPPGNGELNISVDSSAGGDVLGTLMEEEEEEEDIQALCSPIRERGGFEFPTNEEERKKRKQAEQEVIKRTRRTSLTPAPLKLSGRPASLFLSPRAPSSSQSNGISPSNSLPIFAVMQQMQSESQDADVSQNNSSVEADYPVSTPTMRDVLSAPISAQQSSTSGISLSQSQRKLAEARLAGALPEASMRSTSGPTVEIKRSWRASMPSAPSAAVQQSLASTGTGTQTNVTAPSNTPTKGMRALRLATNLNGPRSDALQHHPNAESTSSFSSSASYNSSAHTGPPSSFAGTTSTPVKRGSIVYNPSAANNELGNVSQASRRSSIQYRTSPLESNHAGDLSTSSISSTSSFGTGSPMQANLNSSSGSGVPFSMFEELKSKHQRDVTLLDEARRTISRLEAELTSEAQRTRREYDELERWSAEEKRSLGSRIEHLEASIVEVTQVREAREEHHLAELKQLRANQKEIESQLEDAQAERDMLREDVEGWRTRCSDLERSLRSERQSSPLLNAATRDGSISPIITDFDAPPTPQAIKLLKDMRAQILSLAHSLEQEREQHSKTRQEKDEMTLRNARLLRDQNAHGDDTISSNITADTTSNGDEKTDFSPNYTLPAPPSSSSLIGTNAKMMMETSSSSGSLNGLITVNTDSSPAAVRRGYSYSSVGSNGSGSNKKKRNHVFAYDSSMESGMGSASMGSVSGTTHQTSEYLGSPGGGEHETRVYGKEANVNNEKDDEAFLAEVQADLVGLGMSSSLGTLAEEEELSPEKETVSHSLVNAPINAGPSSGLPVQEVYTVHHQPSDSFDIEAGGRPSDVESTAPPTPALEHQSPYQRSLPTMSIDAQDGQSNFTHNSLSVASSSGSYAEPASPLPSQSHSSHDTITTPGRNSSENGQFASQAGLNQGDIYDEGSYSDNEEDDQNELPAPPAPRPEFIREWSFSKALSAVQKSDPVVNGRPKLRIGTQGLNVMANGQRRRKAKKNVSIDDFFGIMNLDSDIKLPPLPTPEEALDMPPLRFENEQEMAMSTSTSYNSAHSHGISPRWPSTIRPPVAKSSRAYGQSLSSRSSSTLSPSGSFTSYRTSSQLNRNGGDSDGYHGEERIVSAPGGTGGGMFSRVVSITSALSSGLGGYLLGGGGATSPQSAPAFKSEASASHYVDRYGQSSEHHHQEYDDRNASISWAVTPRREVEEA